METHKKLQPKLVPGYTYKQVELLKEIMKQGKDVDIAIVSYDEKPGLQAIGNKYPDLMPVEEKYSSVSRDYEYIRPCRQVGLANPQIMQSF